MVDDILLCLVFLAHVVIQLSSAMMVMSWEQQHMSFPMMVGLIRGHMHQM